MHMQGTPGDMQVNPQYEDVIAEINGFFAERIGWMEGQGIARSRIIVDPGIGFGKTLEHNLAILRNIQAFKQHGCPVLIGHSRKSFLGATPQYSGSGERLRHCRGFGLLRPAGRRYPPGA